MAQTNVSIRMDEDLKKQFDPFYSESNMNHLKKVVSDIETGKAKFVVKSMEELEAMENG